MHVAGGKSLKSDEGEKRACDDLSQDISCHNEDFYNFTKFNKVHFNFRKKMENVNIYLKKI